MDFKKFHVNNDIREAETLPKRFYKDKGIYEEVKEKILLNHGSLLVTKTSCL